MGRLIRLIFVLGATFVFGIMTERELAASRCEAAGGTSLGGVCLPNENWGVSDG